MRRAFEDKPVVSPNRGDRCYMYPLPWPVLLFLRPCCGGRHLLHWNCIVPRRRAGRQAGSLPFISRRPPVSGASCRQTDSEADILVGAATQEPQTMHSTQSSLSSNHHPGCLRVFGGCPHPDRGEPTLSGCIITRPLKMSILAVCTIEPFRVILLFID